MGYGSEAGGVHPGAGMQFGFAQALPAQPAVGLIGPDGVPPLLPEPPPEPAPAPVPEPAPEPLRDPPDEPEPLPPPEPAEPFPLPLTPPLLEPVPELFPDPLVAAAPEPLAFAGGCVFDEQLPNTKTPATHAPPIANKVFGFMDFTRVLG